MTGGRRHGRRAPTSPQLHPLAAAMPVQRGQRRRRQLRRHPLRQPWLQRLPRRSPFTSLCTGEGQQGISMWQRVSRTSAELPPVRIHMHTHKRTCSPCPRRLVPLARRQEIYSRPCRPAEQPPRHVHLRRWMLQDSHARWHLAVDTQNGDTPQEQHRYAAVRSCGGGLTRCSTSGFRAQMYRAMPAGAEP